MGPRIAAFGTSGMHPLFDAYRASMRPITSIPAFMSEYLEDRRLERRYPTAGEARVRINGAEHLGRLMDVSVNGLRITRPPDCELAKGDRLSIALRPDRSDPVQAEVTVVYVSSDQVGFEFHDMPPNSFRQLALMLAQEEREILHARFEA